jgi:Rrf2 family protein
MLRFSRNTDYALIALAHLAGRGAEVASAREIAETYRLSTSLVMKVLKVLQNKAIVKSVRGMKGGYGLGVDLHTVSLYDLIEALKGMEPADSSDGDSELIEQQPEPLPTEPALIAVHSKLMRFLRDVKLSDLVLPGRRIDVPVEMVRRKTNPKPKSSAVSNVSNVKVTVAPLAATN